MQEALETVRERAVEAGVPVGVLGFGTDDVNQKAANGYQILHVGSTTGVLQQTITGWLDQFEGQRSDLK